MEYEQRESCENVDEIPLLETMVDGQVTRPDLPLVAEVEANTDTASKKEHLPHEVLTVIEDLKRTATGKRHRSELREQHSSVESTKLTLTDNLQTLRALTSFGHLTAAIHLNTIDHIAQEKNKDDLKTYADHVTKQCFVELFYNIWNNLDRFQNKDTMDPTHLVVKILLLNSAIVFSDASSDFCFRFGDVGALMSLFNELDLPTLSVSAVDHSGSKLEWHSPREYVKRILVIMYNVVKYWEPHRRLFRDANVAPILEKYLKCSFMLIRARALFVLSYIVNEDEHDNFNTSGENIKYFVKILKHAMNSKNHFSRRYTFSVVDVLGAITRLATHDENKELFVENEILPLLNELLTSDNSTAVELHNGALIVWSLSFSEKNKLIIKSSNIFISALTNLIRTDDPELKSACHGALWELDEKKATAKGQDGARYHDEKTPHVMLSYQWEVQPLIILVKEKLERAGFKVWIDIEKMGGSTLETMAKAIENAAVVLICYTEKYKDSSNCRTEAEYAYKLKKDVVPLKLQTGYRPDGWLGILIGTKLWFDMSNEERLQQNIGSLIKELDSRGRVDVKHIVHTAPSTTCCIGLKTPVKENKGQMETKMKQGIVVTWNTSDVMRWLEDHGLSQYRTRFDDYDGKTILGLKSMARDAPEFFFRSLKKKLQIKSLVDMIKLKQALDELN